MYVCLTKNNAIWPNPWPFFVMVFAVVKQQCLLLQTKLVQKAARATTKENSRPHWVYKYFIFAEDEKVYLHRTVIHPKSNSWTYKIIEVAGLILIVLRFQFSIYNVYITNQFQTTFTQGGARRKTLKNFVAIAFKNSASGRVSIRKVNSITGVDAAPLSMDKQQR